MRLQIANPPKATVHTHLAGRVFGFATAGQRAFTRARVVVSKSEEQQECCSSLACPSCMLLSHSDHGDLRSHLLVEDTSYGAAILRRDSLAWCTWLQVWRGALFIRAHAVSVQEGRGTMRHTCNWPGSACTPTFLVGAGHPHRLAPCARHQNLEHS